MPREFSRAATSACLALALVGPARGQEPVAVELQPLAAATERVVAALEVCGAPLPDADLAALQAAYLMEDEARGAARIQEVLDRHCLAFVNINPESRVKAAEGPAPRELVQNGWRSFLVKVHNEGAVTAPLRVESPNAEPLGVFSSDAVDPPPGPTTADLRQRFLDIETFDGQPMRRGLSGLAVEYRIVSLHSRDVGLREATLCFDVGQGTQDLGFRSDLPLLFECAPALELALEVLDEHGQPTTAAFVVRDRAGRIAPAKMRRVPPDFVFQDQVYRADGETLRLAPGEYEVRWGRGPEYVEQRRTIRVDAEGPLRESFRLVRWIDPSERGWWSGDHHVHAAGCSHYESPSKGVEPEDILRHVVGELKLANTEVAHARAEHLHVERPFDTVLARAVAPPAELLTICRHLTAPGSKLLLLTASHLQDAFRGLAADFVVRSVPKGGPVLRSTIVQLERVDA